MSDKESDTLDAALNSLRQLIRKRVQKLEEREEAFKRMKTAFEAENPNLGNPSDVLRLNVGGTRIDVLRRTLTSVEGSMLATRFSGRWDDSLEKDADGNCFIDQPIELFVPMVNYLRAQACMTPKARPVKSPDFRDGVLNEKQQNFVRMLEYYGMSLGINPVGVYSVGNSTLVVAGAPDYKVETENWSTFQLRPKLGNNSTRVKSYEIALGKSTSAQLGWATTTPKIFEQGVGYTAPSIAFDCSRSGIAVCTNMSTTNSTTNPSQAFFSISNLASIDEGTVIRCENYGKSWFVNGTLVAPANKSSNVLHLAESKTNQLLKQSLEPYFSVKGSIRIVTIELDY